MVNLSELDLTANRISCISASGLHRCTKLKMLALAGNAIADVSEVAWLKYCKSVQSVRTRSHLRTWLPQLRSR